MSKKYFDQLEIEQLRFQNLEIKKNNAELIKKILDFESDLNYIQNLFRKDYNQCSTKWYQARMEVSKMLYNKYKKLFNKELEQKTRSIKEITIVKTSAMGPTVSDKMQGTACIKIDGKIERHWCECMNCSECPYIK